MYYYKCGDPLEGLSEEFSFTTPPAVGTEKPFSVAVYGDMGITNSEGTIARLIDTMPDYDFIFHVGDFAYADDRLGTQTYEDVWNQWQEEVQPIAAHKAYMAWYVLVFAMDLYGIVTLLCRRTAPVTTKPRV